MPTAAPRHPLVTVITPSYNRAGYLDETIQSILSQNYPNLDYIVLDDGSTDNSREILACYDGQIRWQSHPNMGETRTVNKAFSMALGEVIVVVNSDDPLRPGAIAAAVEFLESHPNILVAYPDWQFIDAHSVPGPSVQVRDYDYRYMLGHHHCLVGPGAFFRRKTLELIQGRDPEFRYVGDFDFWLRLGLHGPFARIPQTLATFRTHPDSASTAARGIAMADEHVRMIRKFYANPSLPPEIRALKRQAMSWAHFVAAASCGSARMSRLWHAFCFVALCPSNLFENVRTTLNAAPPGTSRTAYLLKHTFARLRGTTHA